MTKVLLFAEHELNQRELASVLVALRALPFSVLEVTVLVPFHGQSSATLMDEIAASRGAPAGSAVADLRRDSTIARTQARRALEHIVGALRGEGIHAAGEVVPTRDQVRDLVAEAWGSNAAAALLVTAPHRVSHLLHRDLAHRLRRAGLAEVVIVNGLPTQREAVEGDAERPPEEGA